MNSYESAFIFLLFVLPSFPNSFYARFSISTILFIIYYCKNNNINSFYLLCNDAFQNERFKKNSYDYDNEACNELQINDNLAKLNILEKIMVEM